MSPGEGQGEREGGRLHQTIPGPGGREGEREGEPQIIQFTQKLHMFGIVI